MSNFSEQTEKSKEKREYEKLWREKRSGFYYNLAQLSFAALVLGGIMPLITNENIISSLIAIPLGGMSTYFFSTLASKTLKL